VSAGQHPHLAAALAIQGTAADAPDSGRCCCRGAEAGPTPTWRCCSSWRSLPVPGRPRRPRGRRRFGARGLNAAVGQAPGDLAREPEAARSSTTDCRRSRGVCPCPRHNRTRRS
jgi:hypothetical protein